MIRCAAAIALCALLLASCRTISRGQVVVTGSGIAASWEQTTLPWFVGTRDDITTGTMTVRTRIDKPATSTMATAVAVWLLTGGTILP